MKHILLKANYETLRSRGYGRCPAVQLVRGSAKMIEYSRTIG